MLWTKLIIWTATENLIWICYQLGSDTSVIIASKICYYNWNVNKSGTTPEKSEN